MDELQARFGQKLLRLRTQKEISQEALAASAGLHRTYVSSVERGERNVTLSTIKKLADALGVTLAEMMPEG